MGKRRGTTTILTAIAVLALIAVIALQLLAPVKLAPSQKERIDAMAHFLKAETYHTQTNYQESQKAYAESIRLGLEHPWIAYQMGRNYNYMGKPGQAFDVFLFLIQDPESFPVEMSLINFAISALKVGQDAEGVASFQEALSYNFRPGYCYYQLGIHFKRQGNLDLTEEMMTKSYQTGHDRSQCSAQLASIAGARRNYAKAEDLYRRAIKENPENLSAYNELGKLLVLLRRFPEAEETFQQGIAYCRYMPYQPQMHATLLINLGYVYGEQGRLMDAITAVKAAILYAPQYMPAYENLGELYLKINQPRSAIQVFRQALSIDPNYYPIKLRLQQLLAPVPDTSR